MNPIRALLMLKGNVNPKESGIAALLIAAGVFGMTVMFGVAAIIAALNP